MDVSSVSSSSALAASIQPQRSRPPEQDNPPIQFGQPSQQAQGNQPVQGATSVDESAASARVEAEKNRPTVNINGQTVGTRVNTTA